MARKSKSDYLNSDVDIGKAVFKPGEGEKAGTIVFEGATHAKLEELEKTLTEKRKALVDAISNNEERAALTKKIANRMQADEQELAEAIKVANFSASAADHPNVREGLVTELRKAMQQHHGEEFKAAEEAHEAVAVAKTAVTDAQKAFLKSDSFDIKRVGGVTESNLKEAEKAVEGFHKKAEEIAEKAGAVAKAAAKEGKIGFMGNAYKGASTGMKVGRGALTGVGAIMALHSLKSTRTNSQGEQEARSGLGRFTEAVLGVGAVTAGSFVGRR